MRSSIGIVVVHHVPLFSDVIAMRLSAEEDFAVMATIADPERAIVTIHTLCPDVVVVDATDNGSIGTEFPRALHALPARPRIVVIGAGDDPAAVCECLDAGAHAWVAAQSGPPELVTAIRGVMRDEVSVPQPLLTAVIRHLLAAPRTPGDAQERLATLSERERQVLDLMVSGLHRDAIARHLGVSLHTVRTHAQNAFAKLGVHSSLEAVHLAVRAGVRPQLTVVTNGGERHAPTADG